MAAAEVATVVLRYGRRENSPDLRSHLSKPALGAMSIPGTGRIGALSPGAAALSKANEITRSLVSARQPCLLGDGGQVTQVEVDQAQRVIESARVPETLDPPLLVHPRLRVASRQAACYIINLH